MESRSFRNKKIKSQIRLFFPTVLLAIALIFIGFGTFENQFLCQFKMALKETIAPIVHVVSAPVRWAKDGLTATGDFIATYQNNKELIIENNKLKEWQHLALQLQSEQGELKKLLNYTPPPQSNYITAKVLADDGHYFVKSLIVLAGQKDGVKKGFVAMTPNGVLGRIVEVGHQMSRLMLLTDHASRLPVMIGPDHVFAILTGDNSPNPKLKSFPENAIITVEDIVLTSGQIGVYPSGLPIGQVESVDNGEIQIHLFEENQFPIFVRLVDFKLDSVLLDTTCEIEEQKK